MTVAGPTHIVQHHRSPSIYTLEWCRHAASRGPHRPTGGLGDYLPQRRRCKRRTLLLRMYASNVHDWTYDAASNLTGDGATSYGLQR
jgi:hypothetical protein